MNSTQSTTQAITQSKKQAKHVYKLPPMWYDLRVIDPRQALAEIKLYSHDLTALDEAFRQEFIDKMAWHFRLDRIMPVFIGYIPAPPLSCANRSDILKKVIGHHGCWLKTTTENSGAHFIWFDRNSNNFLFWAPTEYSIIHAISSIRWRITKYFEFKYPVTLQVIDNRAEVEVPKVTYASCVKRLNETPSPPP